MKKTALKIALTLSATLLCINELSAQMRTPFETAPRGENGKRVYEYPNAQFGKSSFSVFYGYGAINNTDSYSNKIFDSKYQVGLEFQSVSSSNIGTIGFSYNNQLTPWLELSIPFAYSYSKGEFPDLPTAVSKSKDYHDSWISVTPNVKVSWLFNDKWHFYSRAGVGFGIGNRYEDFQAELNSQFAMSWHFSPVGMEYGRRVSVFVEAGYGYLGIVNAGLKVRFNKSSVNPDGTKRETRTWYDNLVR